MVYAEVGKVGVRQSITFNGKQYMRYSNMRSRAQAKTFASRLRKKNAWRARVVPMYDKTTKDRYYVIYVRKHR
jgi:hypothetical protein